MRTIRGRMVLAIFLVGCIPLLAGLILAWMSGMRSLRDVIGGNLQALAAQVADRVTMLVQSEIQNVQLLASAPLRVRLPVILANRAYGADSAAARALIEQRAELWRNGTEFSERLLNSELSRFLLETKVRGGDKVAGLLITDRYGALVAASSEPDRYFFGDQPWWEALQDERSGHVFITDVIAGRQGSFRTPEETIDIAVSILDDHQQAVIGAIKATYRFDALFALINQIRIGQTGHAMLFNAAGQPLVCPILPRQAHRIHEQLMGLIVSAEPGWGIAEDDGHGARDTVVGFAPVRGLGPPINTWHIFVRQPPSESYAPIREQIANLALIGLVMVGFLAAMGRYVAARIARPIQVLRQSVEAISQGTYDGSLTIETGDEFEELATTVHRMADRLKASRAELETLNRTRACRVDEKTQEAAAQMRKLELTERLAALGKVASGIAHEINNPLGIIINRIECMEAEAAQLPLPADVMRDLQAIRAQAERILRVTRGMLTLSRHAATTFKPIDVACVIRTALAVAAERVAARGVRLDSIIEADLPPVMGDRDRLETVLLNLVNNAVDAAQEGPGPAVVTVTADRVRNRQDDWVTVRVSDTGPGIPEELMERVFDPFFTTKPIGEGHGLGLFLAHGIVTEHRGRIEVANGGPGAVFTVWLPALPSPETSEQDLQWELRAKS
ncbi:MAG TPA: ATP-binding protein [Nitrospiraceae bacterium]|nr:ATP-binding protein [Nitrospiraceae bacterium]